MGKLRYFIALWAAKLSIAAEQYALTHLDKPLKSYDFLKTVLP